MTERKYCCSGKSLENVADQKATRATFPFLLLKTLPISQRRIGHPLKSQYLGQPNTFQDEWHLVFFNLFCFSHFRDLTTVQSAPILRMAQTVWKNVQMAYRGQTVSFSSMLMRTGSATHAIQTALKGKHRLADRDSGLRALLTQRSTPILHP